MRTRVLVLLATHNGLRWLESQLASIRSQEHVDVSILASDDASTDGTFEYLQAAGVPVLPERGPYGSAGMNFFHLLSRADFSTHDFVALSDQDDIWLPRKLARAIECLERTGSDGYGANVMAFWEDGRETLIDKAQPQREWDYLFEGGGPGCTYVCSKRLARSIQDALRENPAIPQEVTIHDWFVYAWARSHAFSWYLDAEPVMRYRQHASNQLGANMGSPAIQRRLGWLRSGWFRERVEALVRACGIGANRSLQTLLDKTWKGRLALALSAGKCRRRRRDALILAAASILGWF